MIANLPPCPRCKKELIVLDILVTEDDTQPAITCINEKCGFLVCETINEFLYEDFNDLYHDCWD